jgi:hypothetical protein
MPPQGYYFDPERTAFIDDAHPFCGFPGSWQASPGQDHGDLLRQGAPSRSQKQPLQCLIRAMLNMLNETGLSFRNCECKEIAGIYSDSE